MTDENDDAEQKEILMEWKTNGRSEDVMATDFGFTICVWDAYDWTGEPGWRISLDYDNDAIETDLSMWGETMAEAKQLAESWLEWLVELVGEPGIQEDPGQHEHERWAERRNEQILYGPW